MVPVEVHRKSNSSADDTEDPRYHPPNLEGQFVLGGELLQIPGYETKISFVMEGIGNSQVRKGDTVIMHAFGIMIGAGWQVPEKFEGTEVYEQEEPLTFTAGVGQVITGWDAGCLGMKKEEIR